MLDLYNNKYDRKTLKDNIYALKLIDILKILLVNLPRILLIIICLF